MQGFHIPLLPQSFVHHGHRKLRDKALEQVQTTTLFSQSLERENNGHCSRLPRPFMHHDISRIYLTIATVLSEKKCHSAPGRRTVLYSYICAAVRSTRAGQYRIIPLAKSSHPRQHGRCVQFKSQPRRDDRQPSPTLCLSQQQQMAPNKRIY